MLITREDIQCVGDEDTLLHFLEEKLNLPISERTTLAQIALPLPLPFLGLDESISEQIIDCQDFSGLSQDALGERRPFLIRFRRESDYAEILREVAESLHQKSTNPAKLSFICANEYFQPFAFAYFNDSESGNWSNAILTIFAWTQNHTRINIGSEHDLSVLFPSRKTNDSDRSKALLTKLQKLGTPLSKDLGKDEDIHSGIGLKYKAAFVIGDATAKQLIAKDPNSAKLIKKFPDEPEKWKWELKNIIYIPSSKNKEWPWSGITTEREAEQVFKKEYPAISAHMKQKKYKDKLKMGKNPALFYWEFRPSNIYDKLAHPKIIYKPICTSMQAAYDPPCEFLCATTLFISTTDLSLLAILNSKLFDWYARKKFRARDPKIKALHFPKKKMVKAPIAPRTKKQKAELSGLVQQILDDPNSSKVPDLEREIDQLVYKLYELTPPEIALIEEEANL